MTASAFKKRTMIALAIAALSLAVAGCAVDVSRPASDNSAAPMRYYGGPKYPMWPSQ